MNENWEEGVPNLIHSPQTDLSVLQEICRLVGPIRRVEQTSEEVLESLNAAYAEGDLNASQVVDEVEEAVDLSPSCRRCQSLKTC